MANIIAYSLGAVLLFALYRFVKPKQRRLPYPPGPPQRFILQNALDFPKTSLGKGFRDWGRKYDADSVGLVHGTAFGRHYIIINNRAIAEDLFESRATLYSDRPTINILPLLGWEFNISFLKYGEAWRQHRRLCHQNFHQEAAKRYYHIQRDRVKHFLRDMLHEPERGFEHSKLLSVSITLLMMYGYTAESLDDPVVTTADKGAELAMKLLGVGSMINLIPFLRHIPAWVPGTHSVRAAQKVYQLTKTMQRLPVEKIEQALKCGSSLPSSFMGDFMERKATHGATPEEELMFNNVAWTTYGAASDTTISATGSFFYLMVSHPEVQRRAQEEIDRVVGNDRLPDFDDRPSLPYIEAIFRELFRQSPPLPIGVPHALLEDDTYDGYFLPKGASVLGNIWAMTRDEEKYPDPEAFKPERFLDQDGNLNDDSRILAFGFGKRICVGKSVASATMWLMIVSLLACFDLVKAKDELGQDIEIDSRYDTTRTVVLHKIPFRFIAKVRSEQVRKLIEDALED